MEPVGGMVHYRQNEIVPSNYKISWYETILPQTARTEKDTTNMGILAVMFIVGMLLYVMILLKEWTDNE